MSKLFKATMIVTIFSVITRGLGFLMKIILSRSLTPSTLGEYQIAMSIFSVMLTLIASGLPLIVSRKVSYYTNENEQNKAHKATTAGLIIALIISIIFSILLIIFKDFVQILFKSKSIGLMVFALIPALVFSSIYSILRGALWGEKRFFMISFSELFEQLIRIICLILLFTLPLYNIDNGVKATFSLSVACVFSSILVLIMYLKTGNKLHYPKNELKPIIKESLPITMSRTASSIVTMLISFIIPLRLTTFGFSPEQAMAEFGIVTGMALPLITIPGTFISSIAVALVPEISAQTTNIDAEEVKNIDYLKSKIALALNCTLILSFIFVPSFMALGTPIAEIVFKNTRAGTYLTYGSVLMITMGITQITSSILNAIGLEIKALKNYCIGALSLLFCIYFLPRYIGAMSLVIAMLSLSLISGILSLSMLKKRNLLKTSLSVNCLKLVIITLITTLFTHFIFKLLNLIIPLFFSCAIAGILSLVSFIALCYAFNIATIKIMIPTKIKIFKRKKALI